MKTIFALLIGAVLPVASWAGEEFLLTDNPAGEIFPASEKRIATGASLRWVTEGQYAVTSPELLSTGSRPDGKCRVLQDGVRTGGPGQAWGNWGKQYYATFVLDLQEPYLVSRAAIWSQQSPQQGFETFELLLSLDGQKFVPVGAVTCPAGLTNEKAKYGEKVELKLEQPALARYLEFRVKKHPARMQMVISEAAVWGERPPAGADRSALQPENRRPAVPFTGTGIGSGALKLDWNGFGLGNAVKRYRVYRAKPSFTRMTEEGVEKIGDFEAKQRTMLLYPLTPGEEFHYGVTAVYEDGEAPLVQPFRYEPPAPAECRNFGDMLAVNHYWGGGSARHASRTREWESVAVDLLGDTPFKAVRWWECYPEIILKYYERGIAAATSATERNLKSGPKLGIHLYGAANEPHLHGIRPADFAARVTKLRGELRAACPPALLYAPTVCIDRISLEWLDAFYAAGAKEHFDLLDIHTYVGTTSDFPVPPGYPLGSPEALFGRVAKIREIMAKYQDEKKPLFSSEYGYTDCSVANPSGDITPDRKAAYLVRGLVIHHILGFRRVFVYSFWDEGNDPDFTEHHFGLLDDKLQKKPAYFAMQALGRELGDAVYHAPMKGMNEVDYGYSFKRPDGRFITVVWNGASRMAGRFQTAPGTVETVTLYGEKSTLKTTSGGEFRALYGPLPVYLVSAAPVERLSGEAVPEEASLDYLHMELPVKVTVALPGRSAEIKVALANPTREAVEAHLTLETREGKVLGSKRLPLAPGVKADTAFAVPAASGLILDRYEVALQYEGKFQSRSERRTAFVRRLAEKPGVTTARMAGYEDEVYRLVDDALEITVDPKRGGRILEIFDRRTGANQITATYDRLAGLHNIPFYYSIWDEVRAPRGLEINRNAPYRVKTLPNGLELSAESSGKLRLVKTLLLQDGGRFEQQTNLTNNSGAEVACGYYLHPEYTVGGVADSHADYLLLPLGGEAVKLPYWSALGDRSTAEFSAGWWELVDPVRKVKIRQEFDPAAFRKPRLWFGVGCCNLEMESPRGMKLAPGKSWQGDLKWYFGPSEDK